MKDECDLNGLKNNENCYLRPRLEPRSGYIKEEEEYKNIWKVKSTRPLIMVEVRDRLKNAHKFSSSDHMVHVGCPLILIVKAW